MANLEQSFTALLVKYAELLTGDTTPEMVEKIKITAIYNHISKTMPPLINHWNQTHPEAKEEIRKMFEEIKSLNEALRESRKKSE